MGRKKPLTPAQSAQLDAIAERLTTQRKADATERVKAIRPSRSKRRGFVPRFHANTRAGLACVCKFPDHCDGSRIIACTGCGTLADADPAHCACPACGGSHDGPGLTGCTGCPHCLQAKCVVCGNLSEHLSTAAADDDWTCSPACTQSNLGGSACP